MLAIYSDVHVYSVYLSEGRLLTRIKELIGLVKWQYAQQWFHISCSSRQQRRSLLLYQPASVGLQSCGRFHTCWNLLLCNHLFLPPPIIPSVTQTPTVRVDTHPCTGSGQGHSVTNRCIEKWHFSLCVFVEGCAGNRPQMVNAPSSSSSPTPIYWLHKVHVFFCLFF